MHLHGSAGAQREQAQCTCRLTSSRAPNAPPTPASCSRTRSSGEPEALGDLAAVLVQPLRRDEELDALAVAVGQGERRLEAEERLVLHADLVVALDDDVADDAGVAALDALVAEDVAVGVERRAPSIAASGSVSGSSASYSTTIASTPAGAVSGWSAATAATGSPT